MLVRESFKIFTLIQIMQEFLEKSIELLETVIPKMIQESIFGSFQSRPKADS